MGITIRKSTIEDASCISEILQTVEWAAYVPPSPHDTSASNVAGHIEMCGNDGSHSIYVAGNDNGRLVGYVAVHWLPYLFLKGPEGYLSELFVYETDRGQGIGTRLLEAVKDEARQRGCCRLMLLNSKKRESYKRSFYRKRGWDEREEGANFMYIL
ncbi:MAG: GNAT family N-acetyltransferase [Chloroflexota bacterium]|nr:GNAT family N-acetyltransferase [Chloroflexota bacterium]